MLANAAVENLESMSLWFAGCSLDLSGDDAPHGGPLDLVGDSLAARLPPTARGACAALSVDDLVQRVCRGRKDL